MSHSLRLLARRTVLSGAVALITSMINIAVLTIMHGHQAGWICLTSCSADVTVNAAALFWVTSFNSSQHQAAHEGPSIFGRSDSSSVITRVKPANDRAPLDTCYSVSGGGGDVAKGDKDMDVEVVEINEKDMGTTYAHAPYQAQDDLEDHGYFRCRASIDIQRPHSSPPVIGPYTPLQCPGRLRSTTVSSEVMVVKREEIVGRERGFRAMLKSFGRIGETSAMGDGRAPDMQIKITRELSVTEHLNLPEGAEDLEALELRRDVTLVNSV